MIPSDPRGLQNVISLLGSEELGCKICISPSPLGRCILRIAAATPLYCTPYFKSHSKPSSPPGNCFVWPRGRGWSRWGALLASRLLPYSRPAPSPVLRPPLPPVLETRNRTSTKLTYYYYRRPGRFWAGVKALNQFSRGGFRQPY